MPIVPDTKDWTWVLQRPCPGCRFDASAVETSAIPELIHDNTREWYDILERPDVAERFDDHTWSPLEYAAHVRDVHRIFLERINLMLDGADPTFANWDQDASAADYAEQDPHEVIVELVEAAADVAGAYAGVRDEQWQRTGRRSDGNVFTVATLGAYHLHDVVHHVWDVRR